MTVSIPLGMFSLFKRKLSTVVNSINSGCRSNFNVFFKLRSLFSSLSLTFILFLAISPQKFQNFPKNGGGGGLCSNCCKIIVNNLCGLRYIAIDPYECTLVKI